MGRIPDRWEQYSCIGKRIPGTRFINFKVPLSEAITQNLPSEKRFSPADLFRDMKSSCLDLGLVVDMTNTTRYYDCQLVKDQKVKYEKIMCPGQVIPGTAVRKQFFKIVDEFLEENMDNDKLIGVHCTHGLNRSGHLVVRYMIDRLGFDPELGIEAFNKSRGHDMERESYLDDLKNGKSHESKDYVEPDQKPEDNDKFPRNKRGRSHTWSRDGTNGRRHAYHSYQHPRESYYQPNRGRFQQYGYNGYGNSNDRHEDFSSDSYTFYGGPYSDFNSQPQPYRSDSYSRHDGYQRRGFNHHNSYSNYGQFGRRDYYKDYRSSRDRNYDSAHYNQEGHQPR